MPEGKPKFLILLDKLLEKLEGEQKEANAAATVPASVNTCHTQKREASNNE